MTTETLTSTKRNPASLDVSSADSTINTILPAEIIEQIIFQPDLEKSTLLVCWLWRDITFLKWKKSRQEDVQQSIEWVKQNLDPMPYPQKAELGDIESSSQCLEEHVETLAQSQRLFLTINGLILGLLRKLPDKEKNRSQQIVETPAQSQRLFLTINGLILCRLRKLPDNEKNRLQQIKDPPSSLKRILSLVQCTLKDAMKIPDLDGIYLFMQSLTPVSEERITESARWLAVQNNVKALRLLINHFPHPNAARGSAVWEFSKRNNLEGVRELLANGLIWEHDRGEAVIEFVKHNNPEGVRELLANGPILVGYRSEAVVEFSRHNNLEGVRALLANGPISEEYRGRAVVVFAKHVNIQGVKLLLAEMPFWKQLLLIMVLDLSWKYRAVLGMHLLKQFLSFYKWMIAALGVVVLGIRVFAEFRKKQNSV